MYKIMILLNPEYFDYKNQTIIQKEFNSIIKLMSILS